MHWNRFFVFVALVYDLFSTLHTGLIVDNSGLGRVLVLMKNKGTKVNSGRAYVDPHSSGLFNVYLTLIACAPLLSIPLDVTTAISTLESWSSLDSEYFIVNENEKTVVVPAHKIARLIFPLRRCVELVVLSTKP